MKRGGFGLARCHGAVNSEKAVVLTDFKWLGERRAMVKERCASAGAWSFWLLHVGMASAVQVVLAGSRLVVHPTSAAVSRDQAAVVRVSSTPSFLCGGTQPCPRTGGPRAQVFCCTSPSGTELMGTGVPWLFPVAGNAARLCVWGGKEHQGLALSLPFVISSPLSLEWVYPPCIPKRCGNSWSDLQTGLCEVQK